MAQICWIALYRVKDADSMCKFRYDTCQITLLVCFFYTAVNFSVCSSFTISVDYNINVESSDVKCIQHPNLKTYK